MFLLWDKRINFSVGLNASSENIKVASEASLCYVDIDKCKVQLPEETVLFPHLEAFTAEISSALDKYGIHVVNAENTRSHQVRNKAKLVWFLCLKCFVF